MSTFIVRPSNSEKEAFRVRLSPGSLLGLKLKPGDLCAISRILSMSNGETDIAHDMDNMSLTAKPAFYAIAWEASGTGMKETVVQMTKFLQDLYGIKLGDKVILERSKYRLEEAESVTLVDQGQNAGIFDKQKGFWEQYASLFLNGLHDCIAEGQVLAFQVGVERREFKVSGTGGLSLARVGQNTKFEIAASGAISPPRVCFIGTRVGGLDAEIKQIQMLMGRILMPKISVNYTPVQGVLLYGAKGVGKTHLINELPKSGYFTVVKWTPGSKIWTPLRPTFIIIDQLDMPSGQSASKAALREIDQLFSQIRGTPCLIIGEIKHPNDLNPYLRSEGKFAVEVEIPIPSAPQRKEILTVMRGNYSMPSDNILQAAASRTHGYVAADLKALLRKTIDNATEDESNLSTDGEIYTGAPEQQFVVRMSDLDLALKQIRPSALQEIFLETPSTRYTDIGGHHALKQQLQNAVSRPLTHAARMAKLGIKPKKGVLLYGPPGCSKTLLVRALANEAKLNFLAVKGAELLSMYVGESERATRELFRKARAASPSIIFFDEIDAIATRNRSGGDLNVLTTLLNEMDGFEELKNVFVVAATNKPESIDAALLRPGRFDNVIYIGPPDFEARKEIFEKKFRTSSYQPADGHAIEEDAARFAERTDGFSGAEIVAIVQSAAEYALDDDRGYYTNEDVEKAISSTPKSITRETLESFETWNAARMR